MRCQDVLIAPVKLHFLPDPVSPLDKTYESRAGTHRKVPQSPTLPVAGVQFAETGTHSIPMLHSALKVGTCRNDREH